jgi:hypothetical protein
VLEAKDSIRSNQGFYRTNHTQSNKGHQRKRHCLGYHCRMCHFQKENFEEDVLEAKMFAIAQEMLKV